MSSFRKANAAPQTPGTIVSSHSGSTLVSTGVADLDFCLGGGIPISHLLCVKQDRFTKYSNLISRYFAAQGLECKHTIFIGGIDVKADVKTIPIKANSAKVEEDNGEVDIDLNPLSLNQRSMGAVRDDKLKIAWRYQNQAAVSNQLFTGSRQKSPFVSIFDITKFATDNTLAAAQEANRLFVFPVDEVAESDDSYQILLEKIIQVVDSGNFRYSSPMPASGVRPVLRLIIQGFASPFWNPKTSHFLFKLKSLLRESSACCLITLPAYLYNDYHSISSNQLVRSIEILSDSVIEIESFDGTPRVLHEAYTKSTPLAPAYHGLIHLRKLFSQRTVLPATFRSLDHSQLRSLAFRVRRKKFAIETFTLPPEDAEEETANCGGKNLEF